MQGRRRNHLPYNVGALTLYVNKDKKIKPFIPSLAVKDYLKARKYLSENGCKILKIWPKSKALYFQNPFGIVIDVAQSIR